MEVTGIENLYKWMTLEKSWFKLATTVRYYQLERVRLSDSNLEKVKKILDWDKVPVAKCKALIARKNDMQWQI